MEELAGLARRLTQDAVDASDLVQETCLRALEAQDKFVAGSRTDFKKWLWTIMKHLHFDRVRRRRYEVPCDRLELIATSSEPRPCPQWRLVDDQPVAAAVGALPAHLRAPYVLFTVNRSTYAAIAAHLRIPQSTVGTRIRRARSRLRDTLEAWLETAA